MKCMNGEHTLQNQALQLLYFLIFLFVQTTWEQERGEKTLKLKTLPKAYINNAMFMVYQIILQGSS